VIAGAVAVAAVLAVVVFQAGVRPTPAAGALRDLAATALGNPAPEVLPGQFRYTRSVGSVLRTEGGLTSGTTWSYRLRVDREVWMASDGSGRVVEHYSDPVFLSREDRMAWRAAGSPQRVLDPLKERFAEGGLSTTAFEAVRSDPATLARMVQQHASRFREGALEGDVGLVAEFLGESPASAELRSALLELMTFLDLSWNSDAVDDLGREGMSVTARGDGIRVTLMFDPDTSELIRYSVGTLGQGDVRATSYTFVERGVVGSIRERPEGSGT
jgi:hypothetical protein